MSSMNTSSGATYWRSLDDLAHSKAFRETLAREFPGEAFEKIPPATRRQVLKVMAASMAFAGLTACRWPSEEIIPFSRRPVDRTPGQAQRFATAMEIAGVALPLLITSMDGRPIKVEGNPKHPSSQGAASAIAQAAILEVYDPDRSRYFEQGRAEKARRSSRDEFLAFFQQAMDALPGGKGLAILSEASSSPTILSLRKKLQTFLPLMRWYEHEPTAFEAESRALESVSGRNLRVVPRLQEAGVIACFAADPVYAHPDAIRLSREIAGGRRAQGGTMNRIWVAESGYSLTGAMADHRLALDPGKLSQALLRLATVLRESYGFGLPGVESGGPSRGESFIQALAKDLAGRPGESILLLGPEMPEEAHVLAVAINEALKAPGRTLEYHALQPRAEGIETLMETMGGGEVEMLLILGGNPAYDGPTGFADLLEKTPQSLHLSLHPNETSTRCSWRIPRAHAFESWGDSRSWDGIWTLQQPLIAPLFGGLSAMEMLSMMFPDSLDGRQLLEQEVAARAPWRKSLQAGFIEGSGSEALNLSVDSGKIAVAATALQGKAAPASGRFWLRWAPDAKIYDGRFANNGWLQELPDPMTKLTWGNAAAINPVDAAEQKLKEGDVVRIELDSRSVEIPITLLPGHARGCVSLHLGYGRRSCGRVGADVGVDVGPLRDGRTIAFGATLRPTERKERLAQTQDHHAIDRIGFEARNIRIHELVREASLEEYLKDPKVIQEHDHDLHLFSLWKEKTYEGEQWGMAIDLSACTGCSACVIACQAENNIPVVGKEQVLNGREMHWIRIDRYFHGEPEEAQVLHQPVACVQCESAPCEQVCPVAATQHTHDGLNAMTYNRCVGTRYCSNNCPYKVRRFNFFNYHKDLPALQEMQMNPDVTVRSRGVMEKCTYCVQRIEAVRIEARRENRPIVDAEIIPACAQTCPAQAIVFGDLNDPASMVSRLREDERGYAMLAELNVRPRTNYLARLRNPSSEEKGS